MLFTPFLTVHLCFFEQGLPSSLQSNSRDSSNCYTTNGLYSNRDTYYSGGKCVNFEMSEVVTVKLSPNRSNIMYVERRTTDLETDFSESLSILKEKQKDTLRVVVYCRTLMICADLFSHFSYEMGKSQYYPPSSPEQSENRLFGMFHTSTTQHSKDVIMGSLQDCHGTVRVVFASVAMGMGIDLHGVDAIIHYGAPSSIENYFLASGRREQF